MQKNFIIINHSSIISRGAFTLFEVSISLAIITFGVLSMAMLFPSGIKAQQMARYQIYASAKALEMVDAFTTFPTANPALDTEAPNPWDVSVGRSNMSFDLEHRLATYRYGIMPLPTSIARRIDSDNDEIQKILNEGGHIYYSQPRAATGFADSGLATSPPNDAQRLVFAVVGAAQSNAITVFPWKAWPYYMPFPSPPSHGTHKKEPDFSEPVDAVETFGGKRGILWEDTFDPDMRPVFYCKIGQSTPTGTDDPSEYGYKSHQRYHTADSAKRYCKVALWYWKKKGLDANYFLSGQPLTSFPNTMLPNDHWKLVQGLRFLSHAAISLTTYFPKSEFDGIGVEIVGGFSPEGDSTQSDACSFKLPMIEALHQSAMNLSALFAATYPYDWAVPRPLQRTIMMDHPLIEWDIYSPPLTGNLFGASGVAAQQWRPIPAQPIQHIGRSMQFSNQDILATSPTFTSMPGSTQPANTNWGRTEHFTLTRPFTPDERCRQLVFWVVDWQSYTDCETAPSAAVDAGRYPRSAPFNRQSFSNLINRHPFRDWQLYVFRNPEKPLLFIRDVSNEPDGFDVKKIIIGSDDGARGAAKIGAGPSDYDRFGRAANSKAVFVGQFGADRNFNLQLDRGHVPTSVRMRAAHVARFNFYDARVPLALR